MTERKAIHTDSAPAAMGPYSQGLAAGNMLFVSGQLGIKPGHSKPVEGGIAAQTHQAMENVMAVLQAANMSLRDVVQVQVYLAEIGDFAKFNEVYQTYFQQPYPARAAFQVAALPAGAAVEILATAMKT